MQRTTASTTPVIIGVGRKTPSNHTIQTLKNTESVMIHSLHPKSPLFTTLPNINPSLLSNKWGTVVEDVVAPNIPRIARERFGWHDVEDFIIRRKVRNSTDPSKRREFDVIAVWENQVIINETKSTRRLNYVDGFIEALQEIEDYLQEHTDKQIIPIFASLAIGEDTVNYLTKNRTYAMAMGDETMDLKNFQQVVDRRSIE